MTQIPRRRKKTLFAKVRYRAGAECFLGSTQKMGAGTNVQDQIWWQFTTLDVGWQSCLI